MSDRHPADDLLIARALDDLDDLGAGERAALDAHIAGCARCGEVVGTLASVIRGLREGERPEAPASILVDLIAAQAAVRAGGRRASRTSDRAPERVTHRTGLAGLLGRRFGLNLAPTVAVALLLLVLFLTGFWAGRRSAPGPAGPMSPLAPAGSVGSPESSTAETRVALIPRPLPEPPRIPFQPVQSEIR